MFDQSKCPAARSTWRMSLVNDGIRSAPWEQVSVHVREACEVLVERDAALVLRGIQYFKELGKPRAQVGPVLCCPRLYEFKEDISWLEDPCVVGEEAKDDAHEELLEVVADIAGVVERVVQFADQLGCHDVRRVLVSEGSSFDTEDEAEVLDVFGQLGEREAHGPVLVEVLEFEFLEVAQEEKARALDIGERVEVLQGLLSGASEAPPCALLLDEEHPWPE